MPGPFGLAILIVVALSIGKRLGYRNNGFVTHVALWWAIGVLAVPILLVMVGCWSLLSLSR